MAMKLFGQAMQVANRFFPTRNKPSALKFTFPFLDQTVTEFDYRIQLQPAGLEWITGVYCDNSSNSQQFQFIIQQTGQRITVPAYSQAAFEVLGLTTDMVDIRGVSTGAINVDVYLLNYVPDSANSIWSVIDPGSVIGAVTVNGTVTTLPVCAAIGDSSTTITLGGTPQLVFAQNLTRRVLQIYNLYSSGEILGVSFGGALALDTPGILEVAPGGVLIYDAGFIPNQSVYVVGATAGHKFTAKQF